MSFYKKVDNIIVELKDINKMYFSLHNRNKILVRERKYESKYNDGGAAGAAGADAVGADGGAVGAAGAVGADGGAVGAVDMPPAGLSGENRNNHHRYWVRSLRSRFY